MKKLTTLVFVFIFAGSLAFAQNNEAEVKQLSDYNDADINQNGSKNSGFIKQSTYAEYNEHTQWQNGQNNDASASVYADHIEGFQLQWGIENVSNLNQAASSSSASTFQVGFGQTARVHQSGGNHNSATVYQGTALEGGEGEAGALESSYFGESSGNTAGIKQHGSGNDVIASQIGVNNSAGSNWWSDPGIQQDGNGNDAFLNQFGFSNTASINQTGNRNLTVINQNGFGDTVLPGPGPIVD